MKLLQMSVQAGLMTLAVVFLRAVALHRLPKTCFLVLWGLVLLRLLVPFSISSQWSAYQLLPDERVPVSTRIEPLPSPVGPVEPVEPVGTVETVGAGAEGVSPFFILWLIGALLCAAVFACSILRSYRQLRSAVPVEDARVRRWTAEHRLRRRLEILQTDQVDTPVAVGLIRPRIVLPRTVSTDRPDLLGYVLTHEYCHLRRLDMLWKLLALCAVCIHWFDPLAWLMRALLCRDLELCCDEMVLRRLGGDERKAYAYSLIEMAEIQSQVSPLQNAFGKNAIEERIVAIMKLKKATKLAVCMGCLAILSITVALATSPAPNGAETAFNEDRAGLGPCSANTARLAGQEAAGSAAEAVDEGLASVSGRIGATGGDRVIEVETIAVTADGDKILDWAVSTYPFRLKDSTSLTGPDGEAVSRDSVIHAENVTVWYDPGEPFENGAGLREAIAVRVDRPAAAVGEVVPEAVASNVDGRFVHPLGGAVTVSMGYGSREHPITGTSYMHYGVDLAAEDGTPVCAAKSGTVTDAAYSESQGYHVTIDHGDGSASTYAHLHDYTVRAGETVAQGQRIGAVGQSGWAVGPHLHFEILRDGAHVDPLDNIE